MQTLEAVAPSETVFHSAAIPKVCSFAKQDWEILSNFWHAVTFSDAVTDKPVLVHLLDVPILLYRAGKNVVAARDLCIHRGVPLSAGWIDGEEIVCAYHGFRYGQGGRCTRIPAHPGTPIPAKLQLATYNCQERYGLVWVCLSEKPAAPLPDFPYAEDSSFRSFHIRPLKWKASAGRQVESFCDIAHFAWLHSDTFVHRDNPEIPPYDVADKEYGVHFEFKHTYRRQHDGTPENERESPSHRIYDIFLPFAARLWCQFPSGGVVALLNVATPVAAKTTIIHTVLAKNYDVEQSLEPDLAFQYKIYGEDQRVVELQTPEELPLDLHDEIHIRADRTSIAYRQALTKLGLGRIFTA
jgi:vanillate O-demethylase monooxygenase subunit